MKFVSSNIVLPTTLYFVESMPSRIKPTRAQALRIFPSILDLCRFSGSCRGDDWRFDLKSNKSIRVYEEQVEEYEYINGVRKPPEYYYLFTPRNYLFNWRRIPSEELYEYSCVLHVTDSFLKRAR